MLEVAKSAPMAKDKIHLAAGPPSQVRPTSEAVSDPTSSNRKRHNAAHGIQRDDDHHTSA